MLDSMELELGEVENQGAWVLRTRLGSSERAVHTLTPEAFRRVGKISVQAEFCLCARERIGACYCVCNVSVGMFEARGLWIYLSILPYSLMICSLPEPEDGLAAHE